MIHYYGSQSQAGQESFVLNVLNQKRNGVYLEIGGYHSKIDSNTYLLETAFDWTGVAFEIDKDRCEEYNLNRKNPCLNVDATTFNYLEYLDTNSFPKTIDYLQLDIEPAVQTLAALKALPLDKYRFSVITFEHDLYADPNNRLVKQEAAEILTSLGYKLAADNIDHCGNIFEDWWADSNINIEGIL